MDGRGRVRFREHYCGLQGLRYGVGGFLYLVVAVATVLVGVTAFYSCNSSPENDINVATQPIFMTAGPPEPSDTLVKPEFSTQLPCGRVDILSKGSLPDSTGLWFEMDVHFDGAEPVRRVLSVEVYDVSPGYGGYRSTLTDDNQNLLWEFDHRTDSVVSDHFWTTERTDIDEMEIEQKITDISFTETYTLNGVSDTFYFPTNDVDTIQSIHESLLSG